MVIEIKCKVITKRHPMQERDISKGRVIEITVIEKLKGKKLLLKA